MWSDRVLTKLQTEELKKLSNSIKYFRTTNSNVTKETENLVRIEDVKILFKIFVGEIRKEHTAYKTKV